jgi:hypothetical protein
MVWLSFGLVGGWLGVGRFGVGVGFWVGVGLRAWDFPIERALPLSSGALEPGTGNYRSDIRVGEELEFGDGRIFLTNLVKSRENQNHPPPFSEDRRASSIAAAWLW